MSFLFAFVERVMEPRSLCQTRSEMHNNLCSLRVIGEIAGDANAVFVDRRGAGAVEEINPTVSKEQNASISNRNE